MTNASPHGRTFAPSSARSQPAESVANLRHWAAFAWSHFIGEPTAAPDAPLPREDLAGHGLLPLLARALAAAGDARALALRADALALSVIQRSRLDRLRTVYATLERAGCAPLLIKGGSFIVRFCPDEPGLRPSGDFDVLIAPRTLDAATRALQQAGLRSTSSLRRPSRRLDKARSWILEGSGPLLEIDLHQRLDAWPLFQTLEADVHHDATTQQGFRVPSVHAMIGIISLHVMRSAFVRPLREHLDLLTLLYRSRDEPAPTLLDDLERWGLLGAFLGILQQASWIAEEVPAGRAHRDLLQAATRQRLGVARSGVVDRLSPPDRSLRPSAALRHPALRRTLLPIVSGESVVRVVTSATVYGLLRKGEDSWDRLTRSRSRA